VVDLFQMIGYTLLDFDGKFGIDAIGNFSARTPTWPPGTSPHCSPSWPVARSVFPYSSSSSVS
jgi:hypothetical protein